ncbi:hypothetical protein [Rhizobium sp. BK176]|uniref:hypothetical protein n=1 Tax=Rhizobium sp. BK176 TaxID=2587071 RepID=UPI00216A4E5A|nr:hypothetical protein [Rhizobium sp. BK176]MCS4090103.1 hypothetical protein [Rhizobium sp. BK176]
MPPVLGSRFKGILADIAVAFLCGFNRRPPVIVLVDRRLGLCGPLKTVTDYAAGIPDLADAVTDAVPARRPAPGR